MKQGDRWAGYRVAAHTRAGHARRPRASGRRDREPACEPGGPARRPRVPGRRNREPACEPGGLARRSRGPGRRNRKLACESPGTPTRVPQGHARPKGTRPPVPQDDERPRGDRRAGPAPRCPDERVTRPCPATSRGDNRGHARRSPAVAPAGSGRARPSRSLAPPSCRFFSHGFERLCPVASHSYRVREGNALDAYLGGWRIRRRTSAVAHGERPSAETVKGTRESTATKVKGMASPRGPTPRGGDIRGVEHERDPDRPRPASARDQRLRPGRAPSWPTSASARKKCAAPTPEANVAQAQKAAATRNARATIGRRQKAKSKRRCRGGDRVGDVGGCCFWAEWFHDAVIVKT
jgi:hypothetical protein